MRTAPTEFWVPVYGINRLAPQQHMYGYPQQMHTPPLPNAGSCAFPQEIYGGPMHFESPAPGLLSPRGDEYYNYTVPPTNANPPLPEPGYFTKPTTGPVVPESKVIEFGKTHFVQPVQTDTTKLSPFITTGHTASSSFKFNSNFKSNDGDFTFSSPQIVAPKSAFHGSECLFGLLTSDKTFQDGYAGQEPTTGSKNHLNFGSKSKKEQIFTENTPHDQNKMPSVFGTREQSFILQESEKPAFGISNINAADKSHESDGGSVLGATDDDGPHFEPVIPLPDKVEVKTGEEDEEELFSNRAKLFRFDAELKEWKERGIGIVKILRHTKSDKLRLLMRREQVLKICANHYIGPDMTLKPNAGSDKSFVWHALDYADEKPKPEQLAIRFKTPEEATLFKHTFEEAQRLLKSTAPAISSQHRNGGNSHEHPSSEQENPAMSSAGRSNFGRQFTRKPGEWDCDVCLVRNNLYSSVCVACQTASPHESSKDKTAVTVANAPQLSVPMLLTFNFNKEVSVAADSIGFGEHFKKKGQWDCTVCLARNEVISPKCVSCLTPNPEDSTATAVTFQPASSFTFSSSSTISSKTNDFGAQFSKKEGEWDCKICLIRNESSLVNCAACEAPNTSVKTIPSASSTFTFGLKGKLSEPTGGKPQTGFKAAFPESGFKFGNVEQGTTPSSFKFQIPSSSSGKSGFSFSMPIPPGGFKFGTQDPIKKDATKDVADVAAEIKIKPLEKETSVVSDNGSNRQNNEICFDLKPDTLTFADLAKSSTDKGYEFGKKDPEFKGFSRAGEMLFSSSNNFGGTEPNTSEDHVQGDELYQSDDRDDIHFEPVVHLPEKVDLVTGEEEEQVLYSQRVKLFRFDTETSQWKERGVGNLKILRNEDNGKLRILMRREQVLKVCANHWITTTMNLKPLSGSDRAWMWLASDFADGDAKMEQLAAKFKNPEQAEEFRVKFEECQMLLLDIPLQTPHKLIDTGRSAHLIQKAEEMKSGLKDLRTFLTEDRISHSEEDSRNLNSLNTSSGLVIKQHAESTGPTLEWDNYDLREEALDDNLDNSVYASPLAKSPEQSSLFRFGESPSGFNFSFQPVLSPSKSPTKLNHSRVSVGTDDESDVTQEEERDGQYFEPVVPLPDLVEVSSGEENEQVVFCHRAKLYRFDKDVNQWKERGIGDLKVLQNYDTKTVRVIMRRDQVLKLCANHRITADLDLKAMIGTEKAWVWTAHDFSEGNGNVEMFAVRFKLQDVADSFKQIFDEAKEAQDRGTLIKPLSSRGSTPKVSTCSKLSVAVLEETTRERTYLNLEDHTHSKSEFSVSSKSPIKSVVSPPKFVFGSDSVKNIFSCEKPTTFTFGTALDSGSLFGFSYDPLKSKRDKESATSQEATVKKLDFSTKDKTCEIFSPNSSKMTENTVVSTEMSVKGSSEKNAFNIPVKGKTIEFECFYFNVF